MTTAALKCEAKGGLIRPEDYPKIPKLMKENGLKDLWIEVNVTYATGSWKFLDNKDVENPRDYFQTETVPLSCGMVYLLNRFFDYKTCFKSGYYALCQNCSSEPCVYFHSPAPTRNWFHAREVCLNNGGSLAVLKARADIPRMSEHIDKLLWIGVHNLNEKVMLQGKVPDILAIVSLNGVDKVPGLLNGESCLIAENATQLTGRVRPCSQKHPFKCRGNEVRSTGKGHNITPSYLLSVLWIMQIVKNHI